MSSATTGARVPLVLPATMEGDDTDCSSSAVDFAGREGGEGGGGGGDARSCGSDPLLKDPGPRVSPSTRCAFFDLGPLPSSTSRLLSRVTLTSDAGEEEGEMEGVPEDEGSEVFRVENNPALTVVGGAGEIASKVIFDVGEKEMEREMWVDALTNPVMVIDLFSRGEAGVEAVKKGVETLAVNTPVTLGDL